MICVVVVDDDVDDLVDDRLMVDVALGVDGHLSGFHNVGAELAIVVYAFVDHLFVDDRH
jgi:hypothetical protein